MRAKVTMPLRWIQLVLEFGAPMENAFASLNMNFLLLFHVSDMKATLWNSSDNQNSNHIHYILTSRRWKKYLIVVPTANTGNLRGLSVL